MKKNLKNLIEEKLKKKQLIILISFFLFFICLNTNSLEIIRDPIAEEYFQKLSTDNKKIKTYIVLDNKPNAFVIENNIYFTSELIKVIEDEDALKAIFFHELGHILHNHYASKKIKSLNAKKLNSITNLLSTGMIILSGDPSIGIASNLLINQRLLSDFSYNSIKFEIQADNYMIEKIIEQNLNPKGLINFMNELPDNKNYYFASHPRNEDRINLFKNLSRKEMVSSSQEFNWIKAKYGKNSKINDFNKFFINLENGTVSEIEDKSIPKVYSNYETYKKGISRLKNEEIFQELISINNNSFLKIEYFNYIIDKQLLDNYELIEQNKVNKELQKEYYFHYIYGKYYAKKNVTNLSNFYFCQFFKTTNQSQKIDYYCNNYDKNKISNIDKSYALSN